jgi:hypothetical protein
MQHLDEGQVHALLDGELEGPAVREIEEHLRHCPTCAERVDEERRFLAEADHLITVLEPPASRPSGVSARPTGSRHAARYRNLAWAASVVLAAGLGYYGGTLHPDSRAASTEATTPPASPSTLPHDRPEAQAAAPSATGQRQAQTPAVSDIKATATPSPSAAGSVALRGTAEPATPSTEPSRDARNEEGKRLDAPAGIAEATSGLNAAAPQKAKEADQLSKDAEDWVPSSTDEALRQLSGGIRLIDGLQPSRVLTTAPRSAEARERPAAATVRVVYPDHPGREIWLDEQRVTDSRSSGLLLGDTLVSATPDGASRVRWLDGSGFLLTLTGHVGVDSLKVLARRVR